MDLSSLVLLATVAGYGDPVDGYPSHAERVLLLWTNAARVAPEEFEDLYNTAYEPCSFYDDFSQDEQTPKAPLYIDLDLTEVSRFHSIDMAENGCFQHESCDGTDTFERIGEYYTDSGNVGENIAEGSTDPRYDVMQMWMCSTQGHRANIMSGTYNEMGPGIESDFMTQDFGAGTLAEGAPPVRMAVDDGGEWYADWGDSAAPATLRLVVEGVESDMTLDYGTAEQGIYSVAGPATDSGCSGWYVYWETAAGLSGTFPEDGSYLVGACDGEDWEGVQAARGGLFGDVAAADLHAAMLDDLTLVGCSTTGGAGGALGVASALAFALAGARRRR
jgi:uncharacterized protein (TIGR03382 family)